MPRVESNPFLTIKTVDVAPSGNSGYLQSFFWIQFKTGNMDGIVTFLKPILLFVLAVFALVLETSDRFKPGSPEYWPVTVLFGLAVAFYLVYSLLSRPRPIRLEPPVEQKEKGVEIDIAAAFGLPYVFGISAVFVLCLFEQFHLPIVILFFASHVRSMCFIIYGAFLNKEETGSYFKSYPRGGRPFYRDPS